MLDRLKTLASEPGKDRTRMSEFERMAKVFEDAGGAIPLADGCRARARRDAVAARGVPRQRVRAASRHRAAGLAAAHPEGPRGSLTEPRG